MIYGFEYEGHDRMMYDLERAPNSEPLWNPPSVRLGIMIPLGYPVLLLFLAVIIDARVGVLYSFSYSVPLLTQNLDQKWYLA
jgi:hypothetical protein